MECWAFLKYKSTPVRTKLCPPYLESGQIWLACHQLADSSSLANDALSGVQFWSLLVVVWAVIHWGKNHKSELIHSFHLCHPRYFLVGLIGIKVGAGGKDWHPGERTPYSSLQWKFSDEHYVEHVNLHMLYPFWEIHS